MTNNISSVFYSYAKSDYSEKTTEVIFSELNTQLQNFTGYKDDYSKSAIVSLAVSALGDFIQTGNCKHHQVVELFNSILGDPVIELFCGKDDSPVEEKTVLGILRTFRYTKITELPGFAVKITDK
jgi:hypothetical protein